MIGAMSPAKGAEPMRDREHRQRDIALFRYSLIREAADPRLTPRERGELVRALASVEHLGPAGSYVRVSRPTLDRWIRTWRAGGFDALVPAPRRGSSIIPKELLELAVAQKKAAPRRSAVQIAAHVAAAPGITPGTAPSARTLQRHFAALGLNAGQDGSPPKAYGRFEAEAPNALWTGDALHGPVLSGAKTYLFAFIDDHSRLLAGYRWGLAEDTLRLEAALRAGLSSRGVPACLYVDNGSPYASKWLLRACAVLGIRLVHSQPGQPAGRGKIERVFGTIRREFLVEIEARGVADLAELNTLFVAWVETIYHRRVHSETGQAPLERFGTRTPELPTPGRLREAFLWSEWRSVTKVATVSLFANTYEVDQALVGAKVELVFDPFDLATIQVRYQGRDMGLAVAQVIGRHVHPKAKPDPDPGAQPPPQSAIDYMAIISARYQEESRRKISYSGLPAGAGDEQDSHNPTIKEDQP
jgi:putative transposase